MSRIYRRLKECEIEVNGPTDAACKKAEEMVYDALGYNKGFYDQNNNVRCTHHFVDIVHFYCKSSQSTTLQPLINAKLSH